jgi:nitroreductase
MEVFEAVRTVLAVRNYQSNPIPESVIRRIVEAARLTASSINGQPWHFIIVRERDTLNQLGSLVSTGRYTAQAAFAIVVAIDKSSPYGVSDASRAIQSMVLTAWSEDVGSNWTGWVGIPSRRALVLRRAFLDKTLLRDAGRQKACAFSSRVREPHLN